MKQLFGAKQVDHGQHMQLLEQIHHQDQVLYNKFEQTALVYSLSQTYPTQFDPPEVYFQQPNLVLQ